MHDSNSCSLVVVTQLNLIGVNLSKKIKLFLARATIREEEEKEREKK